MPESTCLHIQDRESGPIRVVEIPWISVRIGRAAHCEVRLTEDDLAEEACRLYRRGRSWHLVPVASKSPILLDGRPVDASCPLPFDVPFRVGHYCLTLRQDRAAEPDWGMYPGPAPLSRAGRRPACDQRRRRPAAMTASRTVGRRFRKRPSTPRSSRNGEPRPRHDGPAQPRCQEPPRRPA